MSTVDSTLTGMMSDVFEHHREKTGALCDDTLWGQLGELGLTRLTGAEDRGGSGASWLEAAELLRAAAYHGVRAPLAEHDLLACWLLDAAGLETGDARRTVCVLENGTATEVPWASWAERVVVVWAENGTWRIADTDNVTITPGTGIAGEPRDIVSATGLPGTEIPETLVRHLFRRGALARGLQVCAALDRILELSVTHASERTQFGRPLAKLQAVQHLVADIAAEAALARAATEAALREAVNNGWGALSLDYRIAVARSCAGHAAATVVRNAHQVHGAIGTTREHRLHEFTTAALAWRSEFGSVQHWDSLLTDLATAAGRDHLWQLVSTGRASA
ncbi:acyl-CoA dehydrogenase [Amycolatopsis acidicola]|uniref:Acyl-CoA dehydrogenase n=1 Tax=Amycolatopsis acidicola TaxID=2596893 RepID=A0A5N0VJZ3_9PSEU|nr:acyl-CoA dehydrogenase family protein [Amycolatopsis acidicola]KAA9166486.1 acyl-CoA dehydrogenase [Amycolatopsis acidicola]